MKDVEFVGSSDDELRAFPPVARQRAGYQLHLIQSGQDAFDWKPMTSVGPGCREVRVRESGDSGDPYRVFYVASIGDTIFVLHCFQKRSQRTAMSNINLGKQRYRQMKELIRTRETP